jgi:hypothetical protein
MGTCVDLFQGLPLGKGEACRLVVARGFECLLLLRTRSEVSEGIKVAFAGIVDQAVPKTISLRHICRRRSCSEALLCTGCRLRTTKTVLLVRVRILGSSPHPTGVHVLRDVTATLSAEQDNFYVEPRQKDCIKF